MSQINFHITTLANNLVQYKNMKSSFIEAGFTKDKCRYSVFDNSNGNAYEPYSTFNLIKNSTVEPYIIFCHQDVLMNKGDGYDKLINLLKELDEIDPNWAIAGNAGYNQNFQAVVRITDTNRTLNWKGSFPQKVYSLDENFLVIKSSAKFNSSKELEGFHFYGTDLCLNAILCSYSCYVIDFHLTHLSGGKRNEYFWQMQSLFQERWNREFAIGCYVKTMTNVTMFLSRYKFLRNLFTNKDIMDFCLYNSRFKGFFDIYSRSGSRRKNKI